MRAYHFLCLGSGLENGGRDCWAGCNSQQGKCHWCGADGWCCRKNFSYDTRNGCDGTFGGLTNHQCVLKPSTIQFEDQDDQFEGFDLVEPQNQQEEEEEQEVEEQQQEQLANGCFIEQCDQTITGRQLLYSR